MMNFSQVFILAFLALFLGSLLLMLTSRGRAWLGRLFLRITLGLLRLSQGLTGSHPIAARRLHSAHSEVAWVLHTLPARPIRHRRSQVTRFG